MPLEPGGALRNAFVRGAASGAAAGLLTSTVACLLVEPVLNAPAQDLSEVLG